MFWRRKTTLPAPTPANARAIISRSCRCCIRRPFGLIPGRGIIEDYPLTKAECNYRLVDVYLSANIKHTFKSESPSASNVSYVFPLPPDSSVHAFSADINGRMINGVVKGNVEAKADFDEAVAQNKQAALLEQENVEVFKVMLGNVKPGETVTIHVSLVSVVSHEGINDTMRLIFPTSIAPRHGMPPEGVRTQASPARSVSFAFAMSIEAGTDISLISSPSHPITSQLGSSGTDANDYFDASKAIISLSSDAFLDKDLVLVLSYKDMDKQRCVVESSASEDGKIITDAYALTLVPRFKLPPLPQQEYIFLVDRSGSMAGGKMTAVRSALQIMLKSLPNKGTSFNIVSFGTSQSALWSKAFTYTSENVEVASSHVDGMDADMGGTEMKDALLKAFSTRTSTLAPTTLFVLTDGECWDLDSVRETTRQHVNASHSPASFLRVFCMGIGNSVSKAMCEGIARAGNGSAVYVTETEKPDRKLINLIRTAQMPPVTDLSIDWGASLPSSTVDIPSQPILPSQGKDKVELTLFDETADLAKDMVNFQLGPTAPLCQQYPSPGSMPKIIPGNRYSFYAIFDRAGDRKVGISDKVRLNGQVLGQTISLEVPVVPIEETQVKLKNANKIIHLLAARAMIQGYEEQGNVKRVKDMGLRYQLVSSQTSFIAVDEGKKVLPVFLEKHEEQPPPPYSSSYLRSSSFLGGGGSTPDRAVVCARAKSSLIGSVIAAPLAMLSDAPRLRARSAALPVEKKRKSMAFGSSRSSSIAPSIEAAAPPPGAATIHRRSELLSSGLIDEEEDKIPQAPGQYAASPSTPLKPKPLSRSAEGASVESIARAQAFDGSFTPNPALIIMLTKKNVFPNQPTALQVLTLDATLKAKLWCTMLVVAFLKTNFVEEEDAWSIIADKSNTWIEDTLRDAGMEGSRITTLIDNARAAALDATSKLKL